MKSSTICTILLATGTALCVNNNAQMQSPERGFISSRPGETWEEGLICGNGTIGANILGRPLEETIILTHERLFLPGGAPLMPPVLIKMLVFSDPGKISLLPALPEAWPEGKIEGVLCRGQLEVKRLEWEEGGIRVRLVSEKDQQVTLETPEDILRIKVRKGRAVIGEADMKNRRLISLPAMQEIELDIEM